MSCFYAVLLLFTHVCCVLYYDHISTETAKECMFMFGCQGISIVIEKKGKENFYRNWLCQTALFGLYVKSLMCQGIHHILFDNMDSWHIVPCVCIACVFSCACVCVRDFLKCLLLPLLVK